MPPEKEIKFALNSFDDIRKRVKAANATYKGTFFEENLVFDTPKRTLREQHVLIRLRKAEKITLTVKSPATSGQTSGLKVREEKEVEVTDFETMRQILEEMGFSVVFRYEKLRENWILHKAHLCLDHLPFGNYLEIEGEKRAIEKCLKELQLHLESGTTKSYYELNRELQQAGGQEHEESFVFSGRERALLLNMADKKRQGSS